jgi:ATP-dependent protease ClpP protease subunit
MRYVLLLCLLCCAPHRYLSSEKLPSDPIDAEAQSLTEVSAAGGCTGIIRFPYQVSSESELLFEAELAQCRDRIAVVEIDSVGGSVSAAVDFQKAIERHPHPVYCVVDGIAASAAFDILQSCDKRFMTVRSFLMQHNAATPRTSGNEIEIRNTAEALRVIDEGRAVRCARRMKMPLDAYKEHIAGGREWWFSLADALNFGAVDYEVSDVRAVLLLSLNP